MRLEQFEQIIELANTGSFSQAARNLYISQPNLSQSIKQLESELGFLIFARTSDGVIPTEEGRDLLEHMKIIHREYHLLQSYCHREEPPSRLFLRVATRNINRTNQAFAALAKRHLHEPISFSFLHYSNMDQVIDLVSSCQVDFAVIGSLSPYVKHLKTRLKNAGIEYHKLGDSPISAIVGPENPLYHGAATITLADLYPYSVLSYGNNNEDPSFLLSHITGLKTQAQGHIQVNSSQLFYDLIQSSSAVGLLVSTAESFNQAEGLRMLTIADCDTTGEYAWIKLQRLPLSDVAVELLTAMEKMF